MATTLVDRTDLRAAFFKQLATDSEDPALAEHYASATEAANSYVQRGIESAQFFILDAIDPGRWLTNFTVSLWYEDDLGDYFPLPADFLRLADVPGGVEAASPIIDGAGNRWGKLIRFDERVLYERAQAFYLSNDRIVLTRLCPFAPEPCTVEYHHSHAVLSDDLDTIDFPIRDRWLIVAYAAWHAAQEPWVALDGEAKQEIGNFLAHWQDEIVRRSRRTHQQPKFKTRMVSHPNRMRS